MTARRSRLRAHAYGLTALVALLILSPLVRGVDDFPLSTYPMFSSKRPAWAWVSRAVALDAAGQAQPLSPSLVASGEPMQAVATLRRTFARGKTASAALCTEIAGRVAKSRPGAVKVRLDQAEVSVLGWFAGNREPRSVYLRAECPVRAPNP